jgi:hypothetical protein
MQELFASGHIVDFILVLVLLEVLAVWGWRILKGNGPEPVPFIVNVLAGASLMLALRNALVGVSWIWIAVCLIVALVAHLGDLVWRWDHPEPKRSAARRLIN